MLWSEVLELDTKIMSGVLGCYDDFNIQYFPDDPEPEDFQPYTVLAPNLRYLGKVRRHVRQKAKKGPDPYFCEYLKQQGIDVNFGWQVTKATRETNIKDLCKYGRPMTHCGFDLEAYEEADRWMDHHLGKHLDQSLMMDFDQVISLIEKQPSPGYPWNIKYTTKEQFLKSPHYGYVETYWDALHTEEPYVSLWSVAPKEELRQDEKIAQKKIRTFVVGPIEHNLCMNRLFMDQNMRFYALAQEGLAFHTVGMNPFSGGWNDFFRRHIKYPNHDEEDYGKWDSSINSIMMHYQFQFRWRHMHADIRSDVALYRKGVELYRQMLQAPVVLPSGELYQKVTGLNTGCSNTITDNTMINMRNQFYFFILARKERNEIWKGEDLYREYVEKVRSDCHGDDNLKSYVDEWATYFDIKWRQQRAYEIGLDLNEWKQTRNKFDIVYISQHTREFYGMYFPYPDTNRTLSSAALATTQVNRAFSFARIFQLYLLAFFNDEVRKILGPYLEKVRKENCLNKTTEWKNALSMYKTDEQILAFYAGYESQKLTKEDLFHFFKNSGRVQFDDTGEPLNNFSLYKRG